MPFPTSSAVSGTRRPALSSPLELWHLLSLDAPTVAAIWTVFVARAARVSLPVFSSVAMFLAVWIVYAADRLMDARQHHNLEARHRFHRRHRNAFHFALALAAMALLPLIAWMPARTRHAYLALAALLLLWLALVHRVGPLRRMPKEIAVGFFFSAAIFIPTLSRLWLAELMLPAIAFANLCSLNCLFIYAWEYTSSGVGRAHATTAFGLHRLHQIAFASIVLPLVAMLFSGPGPILLACGLSAAALLLLHRYAARMDRTTLRAAADLALLSPLLLLPWMG